MTEEISIEEIKRLDAERTQKDWGICYGGLGVFWADRENDARFITSSPRIAAKCIALDEEVGSLKQQLFIAVQDFVHWRNASLEMRNNLEQLRAENERLRGAIHRLRNEIFHGGIDEINAIMDDALSQPTINDKQGE